MCLLIVYEVVCPPYKTDWFGVQVRVANSPIKWTVPDYKMQTNTLCVGNVVGYPHVSLNMLSDFRCIHGDCKACSIALNVCKLSLPTLSRSNYTSCSFLLHIYLSFFRIISLSTLSAIKQHINKSKTRVLYAATSWMKAVSCFCECAWMNLPHHYWVLDCDAALLPWQRSAACVRQCFHFWPVLTGVPESDVYHDSVWIAWMIMHGV